MGEGTFPTTHWTAVRAAADGATTDAAWEQLLIGYWRPLYVYARRKGLDAPAAEDAVQALLVRLLESDFLRRLDPAAGRLRDYLRTAMRNFLAGEWEKAATQKRGGHVELERLDTGILERELADSPVTSPDAAYERAWALAVVEHALGRLQEEFLIGNRSGPFEVVLTYFRTDDPPTYQELSAQYDMSVSSLKSLVYRSRKRFRELIREEVLGTVDEESAVDDEVTAISALLGLTH